jgi:hypothetical protein
MRDVGLDVQTDLNVRLGYERWWRASDETSSHRFEFWY